MSHLKKNLGDKFCNFFRAFIFNRNKKFASVDEDMLRSVWTELDCRVDIGRVTKGSHIEHL